MSDYIPKVGEECTAENIVYVVLCVGDTRAFIRNNTNGFEAAMKFCHLRPIKSARDKAIEKMFNGCQQSPHVKDYYK